MRWRRYVRRRYLAQWSVLTEFPDFGRLFAGNVTSALGSNISAVAIPLAAVVLLDATPAQMGVLGALAFAPHLVLGLPAGVWVGRLTYRRTVVLADLVRVGLLGSIPVLAVAGLLRLWQLFAVVLAAGVCELFEMVAATSYVPALVRRDRLLEANSVAAQASSVVSAAGAAVGGALVQALTAPIAIAADAASFLVAAVCKRLITQPGWVEGSPGPRVEGDAAPGLPGRSGLRTEITAGLRAVAADPILRPMVLAATVGALFGQMQNVILVLFLARELHLSPALVGVAFAVSGGTSVLSALVAAPVTARVGHGPGFITGGLVAALSGFLLAAAAGPVLVTLAAVFVAQLLRGAGPPLYSVNQSTIRQALASSDMLPRINATWRFLVFGMQPLGALLGGAAGGLIGLRATFLVGSVGMLGATVIAAWSPLRGLRRLPEPTAAG